MTETNPMLEKAAEALFCADLRDRGETVHGDLWAGLQRSSKRKWYVMARAAIEAIREPTEEMLRACWPHHHPWGDEAPPPEERPNNWAATKEVVTSDWQACIDAILTPTQDGDRE